MALMSMMAGADGAASGAAGMSNPALGPEAMAKILGMFAGQDANYLQRMQAMKPTFAPGAPNPGHVAASQVQAPEQARVAPQQVVPSLAQILGLKG